MYRSRIWIVIVILSQTAAQEFYVTDVNFRVDAGTKTFFFENGKAGQTMELYYEVLDGQHGDLDISIYVTDPTGAIIVSDYKKSQNSIVMELAHDGDYMFCLDNSYSVINSKLVFIYVVIEDRVGHTDEAAVSNVDEEGKEYAEEEIIEWVGEDEEGNNYTVAVTVIIESMKRTLNHVVKARHMLDMYAATKSRDSYLALEDTFIVDVWSAFQIVFMACVGMLQVYMIKRLFNSPRLIHK